MYQDPGDVAVLYRFDSDAAAEFASKADCQAFVEQSANLVSKICSAVGETPTSISSFV